MTLTILRSTAQVFCRICPRWELSVIFMITLGSCVFERKITEMKCHCHHIMSKVHAIRWLSIDDIDLGHLDKAMFVRFPHYKVTLFLLCSCCTIRRSPYFEQPHLKSTLKAEYLRVLFGFFLHGKLVLFIQSFIYIHSMGIDRESWIFTLYLRL